MTTSSSITKEHWDMQRDQQKKIRNKILKVADEERDLKTSALAERFGKSATFIADLLAAHGLQRKPEGLYLHGRRKRRSA